MNSGLTDEDVRRLQQQAFDDYMALMDLSRCCVPSQPPKDSEN